MWDAYEAKSCFREISGIRGIAPSVRFYGEAGAFGEVELMHIPANEDVYVWGVEMFSGGFDCLRICYSNENDKALIIKEGGKRIEDFYGKTEIEYSKEEIIITEKSPFDDFWQSPHLVKNNEDRIVKSNFFRCFKFNKNGFYRIELSETFNSSYRSPSFYPIDYDQHEIYSTGSLLVNKNSNVGGSESYERKNSKLKKYIYLKVIDRDKDIVTSNSIERNVLNLPAGIIPHRNIGNIPNNSNVSPKVRIDNVGPWHIKGLNSYFKVDSYYNQNVVPDYYHGLYGRTALIAPEFSLEDFWNNFIEESYRPYSRNVRQGSRLINMRNGILENIKFYGSEFYDSSCLVVSPDSEWNTFENLTVSDAERISKGIPLGDNYKYPFQIVKWLNQNDNEEQKSVFLDLRGSVFKNCVFDKFFLNINSDNMILDGAIFENCKFIGTDLGKMHSGGILFKNCTFEDISTVSSSSLSWSSGGCCCIMGCSQRFTERGSLISLVNGGFDDSIWIRHTYYGISRYQGSSEHWVCESNNDRSNIDTFNNNMWIMGRSAMGPCVLGCYSGISKFNLIAFNCFDASGGGGELCMSSSYVDDDLAFNCFLYNETVGFRLRFESKSRHNRLINNMFKKPQNFSNFYSREIWSKQDELQGSDMYANFGWIYVFGYLYSDTAPIGNLIKNCSIVDYIDKEKWLLGYPNYSNNTFLFSNIDPSLNSNAIVSGDNIVYGLKKIVENSYNDYFPVYQWIE